MSTTEDSKINSASLKVRGSHQSLTPIDRLCIRLARSQGFSVASVANANMVNTGTVVSLTKALPRPLADDSTIEQARAAIRKLAAADVGLDLEADHDTIEGLITAGCRELAQRIEVASQTGRGRSRFGIAEAA